MTFKKGWCFTIKGEKYKFLRFCIFDQNKMRVFRYKTGKTDQLIIIEVILRLSMENSPLGKILFGLD